MNRVTRRAPLPTRRTAGGTSWPRLLCAAVLLAGGTDVAGAQAPDSCAALARFGAFDTRPATGDADRGASFRNWLCQANIARETDLRAAASALGIAPDALEARFRYDARGGADFLDWKHRLCADGAAKAEIADQFAEFAKRDTRAATRALAACDLPPGLHARLATTATRCDILVHLDWTSGTAPWGDPPNDVQLFATSPRLSCRPVALGDRFTVAGPIDLMCARHSDTAMVLMVTSPRAGVTGLDRLLELPRALPDPADVVAGAYDVEIAWRDPSGRVVAPTSDVWTLEPSGGGCRVTVAGGAAASQRSAWFNPATASCSPTQIAITGDRPLDPATGRPSRVTLTLRSSDSGATFAGEGADSAGNVVARATARRRGEPPAPDQLVCKP
jgi:hypothetical protein